MKEPPNENMKTPTILAAIAGAFLCAAQMPAADNGTGKIIVYYSGLTLTMNPVIDVSIVRPEGRQTVALHAGRYCEFAVAPGPHTLIRSYLGNREPRSEYQEALARAYRKHGVRPSKPDRRPLNLRLGSATGLSKDFFRFDHPE